MKFSKWQRELQRISETYNILIEEFEHEFRRDVFNLEHKLARNKRCNNLNLEKIKNSKKLTKKYLFEDHPKKRKLIQGEMQKLENVLSNISSK